MGQCLGTQRKNEREDKRKDERNEERKDERKKYSSELRARKILKDNRIGETYEHYADLSILIGALVSTAHYISILTAPSVDMEITTYPPEAGRTRENKKPMIRFTVAQSQVPGNAATWVDDTKSAMAYFILCVQVLMKYRMKHKSFPMEFGMVLSTRDANHEPRDISFAVPKHTDTEVGVFELGGLDLGKCLNASSERCICLGSISHEPQKPRNGGGEETNRELWDELEKWSEYRGRKALLLLEPNPEAPKDIDQEASVGKVDCE